MDVINKIDHIKENILEKIISLLLENIFLSEGLNKKNLIIHREVEKPDSKRVDFAVKYGFLGTIIIEIKLSNKDFISLKGRQKYKEKLLNYLGLEDMIELFYFIFKLVKDNLENYQKNFDSVIEIFGNNN